eukprot:10065990-Alexandrium_andersonii.AAC.1
MDVMYGHVLFVRGGFVFRLLMRLLGPDIARCTWWPCAAFRLLILRGVCAHGVLSMSTLAFSSCMGFLVACIPCVGVPLRGRKCMSSCAASCMVT